MSLNKTNLERLRQLGRQLPQKLPTETTNLPKRDLPEKQKSNITEEKKPEELFKEIVMASSDGNIAPHLITKLKEAEQKETTIGNQYPTQTLDKKNKDSKNPLKGKLTEPNKNLSANQNELYTSFQRLLLEEEDNEYI
tara:strand:+ start:1473 stop:1886 length:414 start_codon:yes stop_codon:yes gene_type:complete